MYRIRNGLIVTPDRVLEGHELVIESGRIREISPSDTNAGPDHVANGSNGVEVIDANGGYIMPGLIDIHSDYIEHMAAPRPTSVMDFLLALRVSERELVAHGITTMFHSLSMFDYGQFSPGPLRTPENTRKLIDLIGEFHEAEHLIHHRFHARFEIDNLHRVEELKSYIRDRRVHLISFMDHTPGQGQYRSLEVFRKTLVGWRGITEAEVDRIIESSQSREKLTTEAISQLAKLANDHGIAVASHDDDTFEKLDLVRGFGASISEFPITIDIATRARTMGMHTVAGAPNVLLGGSHSGNLSAAEAILSGAVDVLCSDYYPAAMLHAVFQLHLEYRLPLADMIRLVTRNPARAVRIDDETGSIETGKRADLLVVHVLADRMPAVTRALTNGREVFSSTYRHRRDTHV